MYVCIYFLFWTFQIPLHLPPATNPDRTAGTPLYPLVQAVTTSSPSPFLFLFRTEEPAKASTCAHYRRVLQQLALNVHVKHSDLT